MHNNFLKPPKQKNTAMKIKIEECQDECQGSSSTSDDLRMPSDEPSRELLPPTRMSRKEANVGKVKKERKPKKKQKMDKSAMPIPLREEASTIEFKSSVQSSFNLPFICRQAIEAINYIQKTANDLDLNPKTSFDHNWMHIRLDSVIRWLTISKMAQGVESSEAFYSCYSDEWWPSSNIVSRPMPSDLGDKEAYLVEKLHQPPRCRYKFDQTLLFLARQFMVYDGENSCPECVAKIVSIFDCMQHVLRYRFMSMLGPRGNTTLVPRCLSICFGECLEKCIVADASTKQKLAQLSKEWDAYGVLRRPKDADGVSIEEKRWQEQWSIAKNMDSKRIQDLEQQQNKETEAAIEQEKKALATLHSLYQDARRMSITLSAPLRLLKRDVHGNRIVDARFH